MGALEDTVRQLWKGAKYTPDIIVALERQGVKATEKKVIDTAAKLGLEGTSVYQRIFNSPDIVEGWWKDFEKREEESAAKMLATSDVNKVREVGNARQIAGCTIADELVEKKTPGDEIAGQLRARGFTDDEIMIIRQEVGF
jgi:hypothetical protein